MKKRKNEKKLRGFMYSKNMAKFEVFCWNISSSINLFFLKSELQLDLNKADVIKNTQMIDASWR